MSDQVGLVVMGLTIAGGVQSIPASCKFFGTFYFQTFLSYEKLISRPLILFKKLPISKQMIIYIKPFHFVHYIIWLKLFTFSVSVSISVKVIIF